MQRTGTGATGRIAVIDRRASGRLGDRNMPVRVSRTRAAHAFIDHLLGRHDAWFPSLRTELARNGEPLVVGIGNDQGTVVELDLVTPPAVLYRRDVRDRAGPASI